MKGNQAWAHTASALIVAAAQTKGPDGADRPWALYDTGQAVAHLSLQAQHEGLAVHQMGGFDANRLAALLTPDLTPLVVIAVGHRAPSTILAEPLATREVAPRIRLAIEDLLVDVEATELPAVA